MTLRLCLGLWPETGGRVNFRLPDRSHPPCKVQYRVSLPFNFLTSIYLGATHHTRKLASSHTLKVYCYLHTRHATVRIPSYYGLLLV